MTARRGGFAARRVELLALFDYRRGGVYSGPGMKFYLAHKTKVQEVWNRLSWAYARMDAARHIPRRWAVNNLRRMTDLFGPAYRRSDPSAAATLVALAEDLSRQLDAMDRSSQTTITPSTTTAA